jgi:hypothetical protein
MTDVFHFIVTLCVYVGGGLLVNHNPDFKDAVLPLWGVVTTFWFAARTNGKTGTNGNGSSGNPGNGASS